MILAMLVALLISVPVYAQEISPSKETDIERLLQLSGVEANMQVMITEMYKPLSEQLANTLPPNRANEIVAVLSEMVIERMLEELLPKLVPIYDKYFTHDEVKSMLQYLETPVGQKSLRLQPQILQETMDLGSGIGQEIFPDIKRAMEAQFPELKIGANEASAISSVRNIVISHITFSTTSGRGNYAIDLEALEDASLIDSVLGSGTKDGYSFSTSGDANTFTVSARPLTFGSTGTRSFFVDESGVIRYNTGGAATSASSPLGQ